MARERYEDEDDDRPEREERGSRDDRDDRDDERPRRRDDDYDDDYDRPARRELTGMDKTMNSMPLTILFALVGLCCCPLLGIILGIIGMIQCKNPDSKRNSIIVLVAGVAGVILGIIVRVGGFADQMMKQ